MALANYRDVLRAAKQLSAKKQTELAVTIFSEALETVGKSSKKSKSDLTPFLGLSQAELHVLANAMLAHGHQTRLEVLLEENRAEKLTISEKKELDELLDEIDQLALLKAKADYTLTLLLKNQ